jgi:hypothetical protein
MKGLDKGGQGPTSDCCAIEEEEEEEEDTPVGTTGNYSAIVDLNTIQFTITHALVSSVFANCVLAADLRQWRFFSFRGHAVAFCLTLHT